MNSPVGGALDFKWKTDGQPNDDVAAEIRATIELAVFVGLETLNILCKLSASVDGILHTKILGVRKLKNIASGMCCLFTKMLFEGSKFSSWGTVLAVAGYV